MKKTLIAVIFMLVSLATYAQRDSTSVDTIGGTLSYKTVMRDFHGSDTTKATIEGIRARKLLKRDFCKNRRGKWNLCSERLIAIEMKPYPSAEWMAFDYKNRWYKFK
jgi:hypothetical protein